MLEPIVAGVVLGLCLLMLLRILLPARQRQRIDAVWQRAWHAGRQRLRRGGRDRAQRQQAAQAAQAAEQAEELIRRARRAAQRDGNVIRPDAFKRPRKPH